MQTTITDFYKLAYCVYGHFVNDRLIYIGSGETCRAFNTSGRTKHHIELMKNGSTKATIFARFEDREHAREFERTMIKTFTPEANIAHGKRIKPKPAPIRKTKQLFIGKQMKLTLDVLTAAAENNDPCPSNADIAAMTKAKPNYISVVVGSLAKRGLIGVQVLKSGRIVTVNGKSTKPTADHNIKGVATTGRRTRAVDRIVV